MIKKGISFLSLAIAASLIAFLIGASRDVPAASDHALYVTSTSLEDLAARSSIIAIGAVGTGQPTIRQIQGRDPNNPSKPDPGFIGVGSVYQVAVERYLKGSGDNTLSVVQFESVIRDHRGQMKELRRREADFPLTQGTRYLLFLRPQAQAPDLLIGTAQPARFVLSSGLARVESPAEDMARLFPDSSEADLIARVGNIVNGG